MSKILISLLSKILSSRNAEYLIGDFEELYSIYCDEKGKLYAGLWIFIQLIKSLPAIIYYKSYWGGIMIKSYIKLALRNIRKQKIYSAINLIGLALSLAASFLIFLWVEDELSYDDFHKNSENIYRIEAAIKYSDHERNTISSPVPLQPQLHTIPEVKFSTRFTQFGSIDIRYKNNTYREELARSADSEFFKVFSFNLLKGDPESALLDKNSILITKEIAEKYFGDDDPLGKTLLIENVFELTVTGILEKPPLNSSFPFNILIPFEFVKKDLERMPRGWGNAITTFVLLKDNSDIEETSEKIKNLILTHNNKFEGSYNLKTLTDIHLYTVRGQSQSIGEIKYVYIFSSIALFVILVACINFMNLSTARSSDRAKEVGMRKVNGALKSNLRFQFMGESFVMLFISLMIALLLVILFLPYFNALANKSIDFSKLFNPNIILGMLVIYLITGVVSGSYPAIFLASFEPIKILQENNTAISKNSWFRRILVVSQFTISIMLIVGAFIIGSQLDFIQNKELGYDKENLLTISIPGAIKTKIDLLKNEISKISGIEEISVTGRHPVFVSDYANNVDWPGKDKKTNVRVIFHTVDYNILETLRIKLREGNNFRKGFSDDSSGILINQTALSSFSIKNPIGKEMSLFNGYVKGKIIGVIEDFHHQSLLHKIEPMVLLMKPNVHWLSNFIIRTKSNDTKLLIDELEKTWKKVVPNTSFTFSFVDEVYDRVYSTQTRLSKIFDLFAGFAIFIACLGLLGLVTFIAEQRTKEIGIRKVLGANIFDVVKLLSKEMIVLVILGNIIAWPTAYFLLNEWLDEFSYRIGFNFWYLLLSGVLVFVLAISTVYIQAVKAAIRNPVDSLKYE